MNFKIRASAILISSLISNVQAHAITIGDDYHGFFSGRTYSEAYENCREHWAPSFCGNAPATDFDNSNAQYKCIAGADSWHGFYPGYGFSEGEASRNARTECASHWRPELCPVKCGY